MRDPCALLSFDAGACVQQVVGGWWGAIPTDWLYWAVFLAGLLLGSVIGWKRLLAVGVAIALYRLIFDRKAATPADEVYPPPAPKGGGRFTLPDLFGRRRTNGGDLASWIEGAE